MRYKEAMSFDDDKPEMVKSSKKGKEKEEPRVLAGSKDYDYYNLAKGKKLPAKGGNPWS